MMQKVVRIALVVILMLVAIPILIALSSKAHAAGTGMPMMEGLKNPTELATLVEESLKSDPTGKKLLDPARCKKNGSCATAYDYFYGIGLAHPSAKLGNIAELPRYLQSLRSDPAPEGKWHLSRLLVRGEQHTYDAKGWTRTFFPGETVWSDRNTSERILAGDCGNVIGQPVNVPPASPVLSPPVALALPVSPPVASVVVSDKCPNGYLLVANAWDLSAMPQRLRDTAMKLVNEAEERDSENASKMEAYKPSAFSRTLGGQLRREVKTRADVNTHITVNLRDPVSFKVVKTLGAMEMVNGIGKMSLTKDQVAMVVETIWPNGFVSPAISGGERRVELFRKEWREECEMNVHGAKLKQP